MKEPVYTAGDSISIYPPQNVPQHIIDKIVDVTYRIALELKVIGMINIQLSNSEMNFILSK